MDMVKRYFLEGDYIQGICDMEESSDGDYVKFEEYEKLKAQLEKAEAVIGFYGEEKNWEHAYKGANTYFNATSKEDMEPFGNAEFYGGKRAREYFKEKGEQ